MKPPITNCIFCGAPGVTKEHIFPRWSHKYMSKRPSGRAQSYQGTQYPDRHDSQIVKLPGQVRDWQLKVVCGGTHLQCNSGWMNEVEKLAKPLLVPLIKGDRARVWPRDQAIIATWAVLKAMVAEFDGADRRVTTHHTQRKRMMRHKIPPQRGWGVWIGSYDRVRWVPEWASRPFLLLPEKIAAKRPSREATYFNSNSTTQVIGKLFIHILRTPMPDVIERWRFPLPDRGALFRIWPPAQSSIIWPSRALTDCDADVAASAFAEFVLRVGRKAIQNSPPRP